MEFITGKLSTWSEYKLHVQPPSCSATPHQLFTTVYGTYSQLIFL